MILLMLFASADNRLILFDQSDFGTKQGWYVAFENQGPEGTALPVESLRLILAVGDGNEWHFLESKGFHVGQTLDVEANIGADGSTITLDGKEMGRIDAKLAPRAAPIVVGRYPDWATAPTAYRLVRGHFEVATSAGTQEGAFPPSELDIFEKPLERQIASSTPATPIHLSFRVEVGAPLKANGPLVDAYGQAIGAKLPNPVTSDADLRGTIAYEAKRSKTWVRNPNLDPYGGLKTANWHGSATGFYRVVKHVGKWRMISPQGNPLFYTGLCTAPAPAWDVTPTSGRESIFAELPPKGELWRRGVWGDDADYFSPVGWSLKRKYGADWQSKAIASTGTRLAQWGFSGLGKWADTTIPGVPRIVDLSADWPKSGRHLDPFDAAAREKARASLERQLASVKLDPWVVGTSIGNERDETIIAEEIEAIRSGPDSPAKTALAGLDPETARKKFATAYYKFLYDTVKSIDKDHLYFGYWIVPGWWQNESDWDLIAPYCDVIGYDRYSDTYAGMEEREKRTDKPVLLGEFSFPAWYGGSRGYGRYNVFVETDADSGHKYSETLSAATKDPYCVGALWFQYRDEPITGRGPGKGYAAAQNEHYAFGFVDVNDRPKWDLVTIAREDNLKATQSVSK